MRLLPRCVPVLLLSLLSAAACSHPQSPPPLPEQNTRLIYPGFTIPLDCAEAPTAPTLEADDRDWAAYKAQDHAAGQDCRERLHAVKGVVDGWPKTP